MATDLLEEVLLLYGTDYFVEIGTHIGDAVRMAIEAGFSDIRSCERDLEMFRCAVEKFEGDVRVTLYWGDGEDRLAEMLVDIEEPATIWLDAGDVLKEISEIALSPIRSHVILVNNVHILSEKGILLEVINEIAKINSRYQFDYEHSRSRKRNILIAHISEE